MVRNLIGYLKEHKGLSLLALLLATGTIVAGIGLMSTSGYLISRSAQRPMIVDLFMVTAAVRFFGISRAVVRYFERVVAHDLTFRVLLKIRTAFYRQLDAFPQKWMQARRPGELLTGMITDIENIQNAYLRIISPVVVALIICTLSCLLLLYIDPLLSFSIMLIYLINGLLVPMLAVHLSRGTGRTNLESTGKLKVFLTDIVPGLHDLFWLKKKELISNEFRQHEEKLFRVQSYNANTSGLVEGIQSLLTNMGMFTALLLAIPLVLNNQLQGVMLAAVTLGVLSSFEAVQGLATAFIQYEKTTEAASRLASYTADNQSMTARTSKSATERLLNKQPEISFNQVSFAYDHLHVLEQISFNLKPGSKTAIVGPSGSGKSTIINLLTRFWEPMAGKITAHGVDYSCIDQKSLRSALSVVTQDTYIFNRSIRENLLIADPNATDEKLVKALHMAGLGFLSGELDTTRGASGIKLSGGERQLFALSRALLAPGRIWIFDELSANMDPLTERRVLDSLWHTLEERTLLMITHRFLDMEKMDQILVLQQGKLAGIGKHHELLFNNDVYATMYRQNMQILRG